ncbi:MAG TPA: protein translocase subunit SecF [Blastocatellia bacterium]|nr:protein translocase subunit SecF [Blastocatellia bacterium]
MVELFRNPRLDWIRAKKFFIGITIFLLLLGAASVQFRGFNLGVDFTGGTLMTVRFKEDPPAIDDIRAELDLVGIGNASIQKGSGTARIRQQDEEVREVSAENDIVIRTPQSGSETERRVDEDKRIIMGVLQKYNPSGASAVGKININTISAEGVEQELHHDDPLGINNQSFAGAHPYRLAGDQITIERDGAQKGFIRDFDSTLRAMNLTAGNYPGFDQEKVKAVLLNRFYSGKIDLNLPGKSDIEYSLDRIDPLGISGQANAAETYRKAAEAIAKYRTDQNGVLRSLDQIQVQDVSADLLAKMGPYFETGAWAVISADVVGAQVGADLRNRAIYVTLAALVGMLLYIAFRFEWIYGVAAVAAVFHDVLITLGIFSLFQWEISLTVVAALLTLVGYSMNDTIVIFDRIRENVRLRRRDHLVQVANDSINQTLSRTVITSGLTFVSVLAIVLFGGEVLKGFGLALTIGIIIGTYSSIAVASPIMLWWEYRVGGRSGRGKTAAGKAAETRARAAARGLAKV